MLGHLFSVIVALSIKSGWPKPLGNVAFCHKVPTIKGKVKCGSQGKSSTLLIIGALIFYVFICMFSLHIKSMLETFVSVGVSA